MLTSEEIRRAGQYVETLRQSVHDLGVPNNARTRAAGSCFAIAQEHHHAIVRLIEWKLLAAAYALLRIEFEAYIRGEWLSQCASASLIDAFLKGKEPPKLDCLLAELEMLEAFNEKILSAIKHKRWKAMCAFTHTGGLHVQRWNTADGIEANYDKEEVMWAVSFAETVASLSVIGLARLANNDTLAVNTLSSLKARSQ